MWVQLSAVYLLARRGSRTLHSGVTADLRSHIVGHRDASASVDGDKLDLVYYELFEDFEQAYLREKQLKAYSHQRKALLIASVNPGWEDLQPLPCVLDRRLVRRG
ncbi:hypothetical protein [Spongiibacter sp.]|uniref:hypothetical protein n=1 Tax=Spongiibacter sp. TaxID=2024860 RepID=UPI0035671D1E